MGRPGTALCVSLLLWASCGPPAPRELGAEDVLMLELGGEHDSLSDSLRELGVLVEPEVPPESEPAAPGVDPTPDPGEEPGPVPEVVRHVITVTLEPGETLSDLSQRHLGSALRWREIAELNGWSEEDVKRLRDGISVKIEVER